MASLTVICDTDVLGVYVQRPVFRFWRGQMVIEIADDFDLKKIADSGQCFRWTEVGEGYQIIAGDHLLRIRECERTEDRTVRIEETRADSKEEAGCFELSCSVEEFESFWKRYFSFMKSSSERASPAMLMLKSTVIPSLSLKAYDMDESVDLCS